MLEMIVSCFNMQKGNINENINAKCHVITLMATLLASSVT